MKLTFDTKKKEWIIKEKVFYKILKMCEKYVKLVAYKEIKEFNWRKYDPILLDLMLEDKLKHET